MDEQEEAVLEQQEISEALSRSGVGADDAEVLASWEAFQAEYVREQSRLAAPAPEPGERSEAAAGEAPQASAAGEAPGPAPATAAPAAPASETLPEASPQPVSQAAPQP